MINTKFGAYRTNRFEAIQFLVNFRFSSAAILDLKKNGGLILPVSERCQLTKLLAKFGENRTNGSEVIQVLVNFNMAAGGHLGLRFSTVLFRL